MDIAIPAPDAVGSLQTRLLAHLASAAEEWSRCINDLNRWEEKHLLSTDQPPAAKLAEHNAAEPQPNEKRNALADE